MGVLGDERGQDTNTAQDAVNDLTGAINMGRSAAQGAKTVSKAAAQAASGNAAGAVAEVLKDPETVKKILMIILIPILCFAILAVFFLYALPTTVFEALISFTDSLQETWKTTNMTNSGGFLSTSFHFTITVAGNALSALGGAIGNIVRNAWNGIKDIFGDNSAEKNQTERVSDNAYELTVIAQEASEKLTIVQKSIAINKKYSQRVKQITDALDQAGSLRHWYNSRQETMSDYLYRLYGPPHSVLEDLPWTLSITHSTNELGTTDERVITDLRSKLNDIENANGMASFNAAKEAFDNCLSNEFEISMADGGSNLTAVKILSLITAQQGASLENIEMSDFLQYLGYYKNSNSKNVNINVGHCNSPFTTSIVSWKGTFKPQYLMEELKQYQNKLDLVNGQLETINRNNTSKINELQIKRNSLQTKVDQYTGTGMPLIDLIPQVDFIHFDEMYQYNSEYYSNDRGTAGYDRYYYKYEGGNSQFIVTHYWAEDILTGSRIYTRGSGQITYYVSPRGIDEIADIVGLWDGPLR